MSTDVSSILTEDESAELARCEAVIREGLQTFMDVGNSLLKIQERRLHRATHATFEHYCRERWDIGKSRAYQLMQAAETVTGMSTIVDVSSITKESQARELAKIASAEGIDRAASVLDAIEGNLTAKAIREQAALTAHTGRLLRACREHGITAIDPALTLIPEHKQFEQELLRLSIELYGWDAALGEVVAVAESDGTLTLLDGRARLLIAAELDRTAPVRIVSEGEVGDRFAYVYTHNVLRRHLTAGQMAMHTALLMSKVEAADFADSDTVDMGQDFAVLSFQWSANVCRRHLEPDQVQALRLVKAARAEVAA